jgi:hemoglobin
MFEYAGGLPALERLTDRFYQKVALDEVLAPVFAQMSPDHPKHVAAFIGESLGGGPLFSQGRTENETMREVFAHHLRRYLTEQQRRRWLDLMVDTADEVGLPDDPEFRSALMAHLEWGTRIAKQISHLGENPIDPKDHIPRWGWGDVRGPYEVVGSICQFPLPEDKSSS